MMFFFIQSYSTYHFFKAPKIFSMLFALVKPMLSQVDTPKIKIYGNDKNEWTSAILGPTVLISVSVSPRTPDVRKTPIPVYRTTALSGI